MRFWEAVMKGLWGTDTRCASANQRKDAERLVAEAEAKVDQLNRTLDEAPPKNLDEAIYVMMRRRDGE
jgi:hypothetical protein